MVTPNIFAFWTEPILHRRKDLTIGPCPTTCNVGPRVTPLPCGPKVETRYLPVSECCLCDPCLRPTKEWPISDCVELIRRTNWSASLPKHSVQIKTKNSVIIATYFRRSDLAWQASEHHVIKGTSDSTYSYPSVNTNCYRLNSAVERSRLYRPYLLMEDEKTTGKLLTRAEA